MAIQGPLDVIVDEFVNEFSLDENLKEDVKMLLYNFSYDSEVKFQRQVKDSKTNYSIVECEKDEKALAYIPGTKYHICLKNNVYEIMGNLIKSVTPAAVTGILISSNTEMVGLAIGLAAVEAGTVSIVDFILSHKKYIIKLENNEFCAYLKILQKRMEHGFSKEDLLDAMDTDICNNHTKTWACDYLNNDDSCRFKESNLTSILFTLEKKGIIEATDSDKYRIVG